MARTTSVSAGISTHEIQGFVELIAEGRDASVYVRLDAEEALKLGLRLVAYAYTHGERP